MTRQGCSPPLCSGDRVEMRLQIEAGTSGKNRVARGIRESIEEM